MPEGSPDCGSAQQRLTQLRENLLRHHKILLESERGLYEHEIAKIPSATHFLELVIHDPWFAWLHELSELIVLIDETQEAEEPPTLEDADRLLSQARALLVPSEVGAGFARRYFEALQRDPDVVIAHGQLAKLIGRQPA